MIKPPPIQEPWRLDAQGRLASPAWVLWFQDLISSQQLLDQFDSGLMLQSTIEETSETLNTNANDVEMLVWMSF